MGGQRIFEREQRERDGSCSDGKDKADSVKVRNKRQDEVSASKRALSQLPHLKRMNASAFLAVFWYNHPALFHSIYGIFVVARLLAPQALILVFTSLPFDVSSSLCLHLLVLFDVNVLVRAQNVDLVFRYIDTAT